MKNLLVFLLAGVDTVSHTLTSIIYFLHSQPDKRAKLESEFKKVFDSDITKLTPDAVDELEYLSYFIKES